MMASDTFTIVSLNMHGVNQSTDTVHEVINLFSPSCILLQEHWLSDENLPQLNLFEGYIVVASSAMRGRLEAGPL